MKSLCLITELLYVLCEKLWLPTQVENWYTSTINPLSKFKNKPWCTIGFSKLCFG